MSSELFINQDSYGQNAQFKWNRLASDFPHLRPIFLPPSELTQRMRQHIQSNNDLYIGGGDGTLHHVINSVLQGDADFRRVRLGVLGLGSSCSFLKSVATKRSYDIPVIADPSAESRIDLGKVFFKEKDGRQETKFFAANGSIGFLALGNLLFNQPGGLTQKLKRLSTEAANNYIFAKTLFKYSAAPVSVDGGVQKKYLNIQFLKAKHYTGDFFFERKNSPQSGLLDFHLFDDHGSLHTLNVFLQLTMKNEYPSPTHIEFKGKSMTIKAAQEIPLELDGEIYYGKEFIIECVPQKLNVMTHLSGVSA